MWVFRMFSLWFKISHLKVVRRVGSLRVQRSKVHSVNHIWEMKCGPYYSFCPLDTNILYMKSQLNFSCTNVFGATGDTPQESYSMYIYIYISQ